MTKYYLEMAELTVSTSTRLTIRYAGKLQERVYRHLVPLESSHLVL